ncbi:MAG: DUF4114 domain-containing protein [Verrucomicrobia bacterium]|nr:DUF4114 domain-containing protein [Verrucomicrobiota bacterium]
MNYHNQTLAFVLGLCGLFGATRPLSAQTASPVQATPRPGGLSIVSPVMAGGSDARSAQFNATQLPALTALLSQQLGEGHAINDAALRLDPTRLLLQNASDVRVTFLGEGAGYQNTLGFNPSGTGTSSGNPQLIFPNASSSVSTYDPSQTTGRTPSNPLLPGDFVDLGHFNAGTLLDFFLIANGAAGGRNVYSTNAGANPDHINHVVAFAVPGTSYLILGFEDLLGGGDRDFNDVLFAVDIGFANVARLTATPEPAAWLSLAGVTGLALVLRRRRATAAA